MEEAEAEVCAKPEVRGRRSFSVLGTGPWRRLIPTVLVVAAMGVIVVAYRHTLAQSMRVLAAASPGWLLLTLAAEAVSLLAFGVSRRGLLRAGGDRVSLRSVLAITYAGNALSLSVPLAGAELSVVYSFRQFRRTGLDAATTSWSLTVSWICSSSALALLLAAGAIAEGATAASAAGFAGAAFYLLPVAGVLLALRFDRARAALRAVLRRLAGLSQRILGKPQDGAAGVDRFLDEVSSRRLSLPGYSWVFAMAVANWAFDCAALALAIRAVGATVPWDDLLLVYGAGVTVASTGLTPGGFLLVELALTTALTAAGLHKANALAAALAYRAISYWLVLLGGWVTMAVLAHPLARRREPGR